jgi:hypothetical protein
MRPEENKFSGYPAVQIAGISSYQSNTEYFRKSTLIVRGDTCFYLDSSGKNTQERWMQLGGILSSFKFTDDEVSLQKSDLKSDKNGTGGITITSEQNTTNYEYNGIGVTAVNGVPATTAATPRLIKYK